MSPVPWSHGRFATPPQRSQPHVDVCSLRPQGTIFRVSSDVVATWVGAVATMGSAVAAGMAWKAAKSSSDAAGELTELEAARRHDELTPKLTVRVEPFNPGDTNHHRFTLGLDGPVALVRLDSLTINVRDDRPGRDQETLMGGEATAEKVRAQVWGPLRFSPLLGPSWAKADESGRSVEVSRPLDVGEGLSLQMEPTSPPPWYRHSNSSDDAWHQDAGSRLRLSVVALAGTTPRSWTLPIELDLADEGVAGFATPSIT